MSEDKKAEQIPKEQGGTASQKNQSADKPKAQKAGVPAHQAKIAKTGSKKDFKKPEASKKSQNNFDMIHPGMTVKVYEQIRDIDAKGKERERIQVFEGMVLARKHGKESGATITVRKVSEGIGVEKIYPLNSPLVKKIEIVKEYQVRRAKLYYLRQGYGKRLQEKK